MPRGSRRRKRRTVDPVDRIGDLYSDLDVSLRVLVWGPGKTNRSELYEKRTMLIAHLEQSSNGRDAIYTSEDMFREQPPPKGIDVGSAEIRHARWADVIIALVLAPPDEQGGVYRELQIIATERELRERVWIFMPRHRDWERLFSAGSLAAYREDHKIRVEWPDLLECVDLRAMSLDKVEEERRQQMYDRLNARRPFRESAS